ncbi:MAG TPA: arginine--tRNA ligase [Vicinamibacterales bacterium]|nr:arginine--tRNA ligase [Vicinamibacterales bacterium]
MLGAIRQEIFEIVTRSHSAEAAAELTFRPVPANARGDVAIPVFAVARKVGADPKALATALAAQFRGIGGVADAIAAGPYVNLAFQRDVFAKRFVADVLNGHATAAPALNAKVLIEHTSINPNASPHVGRGRNAIIGDTIARMHRFLGYDTEVHYYVNDIGKQIALLVYACRGRNDLQFTDLLDEYVAISKKAQEDPAIEQIAFDLLNSFEQGDTAVREDFRRVVDLCVNGQVAILGRLGIRYDVFDRESSFLNDPRLQPVIEKLQEANALVRDEHGRQVIDLQPLGFTREEGRYVVLSRANGTSMYVARDLAYTIFKSEISADANLSVLGEDHRLYQEQLDLVLRWCGIRTPDVIYYSFVLLKQGKMSTRQGNVVLLSEFIDLACDKAAIRIREANPTLTDDEVQELAETIAVGAVRYGILSVNPTKNVIFDLEDSLRFEGNTGPYLQYSCARIASILAKFGGEVPAMPDTMPALNDSEWALIMEMTKLQDEVRTAAASRNPSSLCAYGFELARAFNRFYHDSTVLDAPAGEKAVRLNLCAATATVLSACLGVLGIHVPRRM